MKSAAMALCLGLLGLLPASVFALDPDRLPTQYVHDHFDRADGLPSGAVWAVLQSEDGYIWLGTQNGLVRFDGVDFDIFTRADTPELTNHDVRALMQAENGDIWIGTYGGGAVRYVDGEFRPGLSTDDGLAHSIVYDIYQDDSGNLWFGTGGGVTRLDADGGLSNLTREDGLSHDRIFKIYQDSRGDMWMASLVAGLTRMHDGEFTHYRREDGLVSDQIHALQEDSAGALWVGTYDGGLYRMTEEGPEAFDLPPGMGGTGIQSIVEDRDGNLWFGTYNNGLIRLNDDGLTHLDSGPLESAFVFDMIEDREGSLWLATRNGLHRLGNGKFVSFGEPEGIADATFVVLVDGEEIWAGTEGSGLFRITPEGIDHWTTDDGLASNNISALALDPNGGIWVGSFGGGLHHVAGDQVRTWTAEDGLPSNHMFALHIDADGRLWVAADGGLSRLDGDSFRTWTQADGLPDALIRQIHEDRDGHLWLGTNGGGLSRFDGTEFENFDRSEGLPGNIIYAFHEDADGHLWIGSRDNGLSLYREGQFHNFSIDDGLPRASVYSIVEDDDGYFWMSGGGGLMRVARHSLLARADGSEEPIEARLFDEADGLRDAQFAGGFQPVAWHDDDGRLWFASIRGLVQVDPDELELNRVEPPIHIESVVYDGMSTDGDGRVVLPAGARNLEIHYTGLSLIAPQKVNFQYRLDGYDLDWQQVNTRRVAYYTQLPPGSYTFRVRASNNDGVWSEIDTGLNLVQEAHYWQTTWFRALMVVAVILLGWTAFRLSVRQFRQREQRLSRLVRERTEQLEQALERVEQTSRIDGLTEVANRGYFEERLAREWAQATRDHKPIGLVMVDIDHFKRLNDSQGHQVGDDCLKQVAGALRQSARRPADMVARYGGEEFVVLLPGVEIDALEVRAEAMRSAVEAMALPHAEGGVDGRVTISAGCAAVYPSPDLKPRQLIERADRALYEAKRAGRNRVGRDPAST